MAAGVSAIPSEWIGLQKPLKRVNHRPPVDPGESERKEGEACPGWWCSSTVATYQKKQRLTVGEAQLAKLSVVSLLNVTRI
jgi:hypothetical protein